MQQKAFNVQKNKIMKKNIFILMMLITSWMLTSCATDAVITTDIPSPSVIITYGIPYYDSGRIVYYNYHGAYYYPYYYNNRYCFHRYPNRVRPPYHHPNYNYRPRPNHPSRPNYNHNGNRPNHRPNGNFNHGHRPNRR